MRVDLEDHTPPLWIGERSTVQDTIHLSRSKLLLEGIPKDEGARSSQASPSKAEAMAWLYSTWETKRLSSPTSLAIWSAKPVNIWESESQKAQHTNAKMVLNPSTSVLGRPLYTRSPQRVWRWLWRVLCLAASSASGWCMAAMVHKAHTRRGDEIQMVSTAILEISNPNNCCVMLASKNAKSSAACSSVSTVFAKSSDGVGFPRLWGYSWSSSSHRLAVCECVCWCWRRSFCMRYRWLVFKMSAKSFSFESNESMRFSIRFFQTLPALSPSMGGGGGGCKEVFIVTGDTDCDRATCSGNARSAMGWADP